MFARAPNRFLAAASMSLTDFVKQDFGVKGLAWFRVDEDGSLSGPIAKNFAAEMLTHIAQRMDAQPKDLLLFVADRWESHLQRPARSTEATGGRIEAL